MAIPHRANFAIEVFARRHCGDRGRLLAAIHEPAAIERVLGALELSAVAPRMAGARSPPGEAELLELRQVGEGRTWRGFAAAIDAPEPSSSFASLHRRAPTQ